MPMRHHVFQLLLLMAIGGAGLRPGTVDALTAAAAKNSVGSHKAAMAATQADRWADTVVSLLGRRDPLAVTETEMLARLKSLVPDLREDELTLEGSSAQHGILRLSATFLEPVKPHTLWTLWIEMPHSDWQGHTVYPAVFRRLAIQLSHTEWRLTSSGKAESREARWMHGRDALTLSLTEEAERVTLKMEEAGERPGGPR